MNTASSRVHELKASEFNNIRNLVLEKTGISLSAAKMELVKRRFSPRLKILGLNSFKDYVEYLEENFETEGNEFCNAITTNLTSFFREKHHYTYLEENVFPEMAPRAQRGDKIRIWSAGCSTGQEPYCLAISVLNTFPEGGRFDLKILATDLDERCILTGKKGSYPVTEFDNVDPGIRKKYFYDGVEHSQKGREIKVLTAKPQLKSLITFNKLNLMHPWPMKGQFDVIFCRNVFIYFNKDTQVEMLKRFAALQKPGAYLCLGHSETIKDPGSVGYKLIGKTLYIKQ